ncbi:protein of unknown function [Burkholderia multivorans]
MDGVRPAADLDVRIEPHRQLHGVLARRLRAALHDLHHCRDVPDGQSDPQGSGRRPRRRRPDAWLPQPGARHRIDAMIGKE